MCVIAQAVDSLVLARYYQIEALDIYPLSSAPEFIRRNSLIIAMSDIDALGAAFLADDILLLHINSVIVVWNLVQDTLARVNIGERSDAQPVGPLHKG
jgi:hypothetical protein